MKAERHENADMICAKANDMNLVVLAKCKTSDGWCWIEVEMESLSLHVGLDFFLCLPQHKEAVLNSLNGGDSELSFDGEHWTDCNCNQPIEWNPEWWYMRPQSQSRIKQKKEKRWIGTCKNFVTAISYPSIEECKDSVGNDTSWVFHEIEVEV